MTNNCLFFNISQRRTATEFLFENDTVTQALTDTKSERVKKDIKKKNTAIIRLSDR